MHKVRSVPKRRCEKLNISIAWTARRESEHYRTKYCTLYKVENVSDFKKIFCLYVQDQSQNNHCFSRVKNVCDILVGTKRATKPADCLLVSNNNPGRYKKKF